LEVVKGILSPPHKGFDEDSLLMVLHSLPGRSSDGKNHFLSLSHTLSLKVCEACVPSKGGSELKSSHCLCSLLMVSCGGEE